MSSTQKSMDASSEKALKKTEYTLARDNELRFEVEGDEKVTIRLKKGLAEVFGTELMKGKSYTFYSGTKIAVFTFHGCDLEVEGQPSLIYVSKETPMVYYINIHGLLEHIRDEAVKNNTRGPVVMICGPSDVGKTTLCKILVNYGVRKSRTPLMIDLDVGQNSFSVPGTLALNVAEKTSDVETGLFSDVAPLIFHFGSNNPNANIDLYKSLISKCAECMNLKFDSDKRVKTSGCIINTCGWVTGLGYDVLVHAAKELSVDAILVLDSERLLNSLTKDLINSSDGILRNVKIIPVPKSGGVVERSKEYRTESRDQKIREYFYGPLVTVDSTKPSKTQSSSQVASLPSSIKTYSYYPQSFDIPFASIKSQLFKIGSGEINDSWLPIGMSASNNNLSKLLPITGIHELKQHQLLSMIPVNKDSGSDVSSSFSKSNVSPDTPITGIICITRIDTSKGILTILSPQPKPLPSNVIFLYSDVQFIDSH